MDAESQGVSSALCVIFGGRDGDLGVGGVLEEVQVLGKDQERGRRVGGGLVVQRHHHSIASLSLASA